MKFLEKYLIPITFGAAVFLAIALALSITLLIATYVSADERWNEFVINSDGGYETRTYVRSNNGDVVGAGINSNGDYETGIYRQRNDGSVVGGWIKRTPKENVYEHIYIPKPSKNNNWEW